MVFRLTARKVQGGRKQGQKTGAGGLGGGGGAGPLHNLCT